MLRTGSRGDEVLELQTFLAAQGYNVGPLDGIFGSKTKAAVRSFQSDQGLSIDGIVGPNTFGAIAEVEAAVADVPEPEATPATPADPTATGLTDLLAGFEASHGVTFSTEDVARWEAELAGGTGRDLAALEADIIKYRLTDDIIDPSTEEYPGALEGGTLHLVDNSGGQEDFYVMSYEYPPGSGHQFYYRIGDIDDVTAMLGPNFGGGKYPVGEKIGEKASQEYAFSLEQWTDGGNKSDISGILGTFTSHLDDLLDAVVDAAGADDPSLVGAALRDPDIMLIMAQAAEGSWTPLKIKAALRGTAYYQDVLYPGIKNFYATSDTPEAEYAMYKQNVEATFKTLGIPQTEWAAQMTSLLDKGVTDTAFSTFAGVYKQAQTNIGFADALSKWTSRYAGVTIDSFEDYFDILAGNAPADILEIAEVAGLQYMADNVGFEISDAELALLSEGTDFDQAQAGQLFSQAAKDLLALGASGLRKGDLTSADVLNAEAGIGGNVEAVKAKMRKLAIESGISDDPTATIFTDFNREGAPIKKGLQSTISEGA